MKIAEIKEQLNIHQVLAYYNIAVKGKQCCCPFHDDKTPSMKVYEETNTVHCFSGNCEHTGKAIDVIDFILHKENCTKKDAIKKAKELLHFVEPVVKAKAVKKAVSKSKGEVLKASKNRIQLLTKLFTEAQESLKRSAKAKSYCKERNLEIIEIGFLKDRFYQEWTTEEREVATEIGVLKKLSNGQLSANMRNCLLFAMHNKKNEIVNLYGRSIQETGKGKRHFYLPGGHQGLYPNYPRREARHLILTECIIDAATLRNLEEITANYEILACYGTNGFTQEHSEAIQNLPNLEEIIFAFDGDTAGEKARQKIAEEIQEAHPKLKLTTLELPEGEDINSLLQSHESEIIAHLLSVRQEFLEEEVLNTNNNINTFVEVKEPTDSNSFDTSNADCLVYKYEAFVVQIWGGVETNNMHRLKVNLHIYLAEKKYPSYREDVNLYSHKQVKSFISEASEELEVHITEVKHLLTNLTQELETHRTTKKQEAYKALMPVKPTLTAGEESQALVLLNEPNLAYKIKEILEITGVVGQGDKGLLLFLIYLTRFFKQPLHAVLLGSSGSGKTHLQTGVSSTLPEEEVRNATSLSENTLYYSPKGFWSHVVLLIEDLNGAGSAEYVLREFMSKQSLTKYTTEKDERGINEQKILKVEGPVCVSGCTTKENIYEDNADRSFLIHVDDSAKQQAQVLGYIKNRQAGLVDQLSEAKATELLKNAQRMLKQVKVVNKYAPQLMIPEQVFKKYRTLNHYLTLINTIALLHQYQREIKQDENGQAYIEVALSDIKLANELSKETLIRKSDPLTGGCRKFFERLKATVEEEKSFFARQIGESFGLYPMKVHRYLFQLEERGYVEQLKKSKKTGTECKVVNRQEYEALQEGVDILDRVYETLII